MRADSMLNFLFGRGSYVIYVSYVMLVFGGISKISVGLKLKVLSPLMEVMTRCTSELSDSS